jgi:hypothetical protein
MTWEGAYMDAALLWGCFELADLIIGQIRIIGNCFVILRIKHIYLAPFVREKIPCSATPSALRATPSLGAKRETYLIHIQ